MYYFKTRTLPLDVYHVVKKLKDQHGLTNWQSVILGIQCLVDLANEHPGKFATMRDLVKTEHPDSGVKPVIKP